MPCRVCGAELGPWEGRRCISCAVSTDARSISNAEAALRVLERANGPLSVYDISRGIRRDLDLDVPLPSLNVAVASDYRFCWAGRALYGLYRHGLYPGPRTLAGVARLFLYAYERPLSVDALRFAMQQAGYRLHRQSLYGALERDRLVGWSSKGYRISQERGVKRQLMAAGTGRGPVSFMRCMEKCKAHIDAALAEYSRRTGRRRTC
jgi:hypothetical protein